ncbi:MAG: PD-(D/E)XK nuclease family protein [Sulfuricaulis sp.]
MTNHLRLSPNGVDKYFNCPREYWYYYKAGFRKLAKAATLLFGNIGHACINSTVKSSYQKGTVDPVTMFREAWRQAQDENVIEYTTTQSPQAMEDTGMRLMELFQIAWEKTGLVPLLDKDGEPFLERDLSVRLTDNVTLYGILDGAFLSTIDGQVSAGDFKIPESPYDPISIWQSDQLTNYQILMDGNSERLAIEKTDAMWFMQLIRRSVPKRTGKGPEVLPPGVVPRRTDKKVLEYKRKVLWVAENVRKGCFHETPRKPHNTPCLLCDYANHCIHGSTEGLLIPDDKQLALV